MLYVLAVLVSTSVLTSGFSTKIMDKSKCGIQYNEPCNTNKYIKYYLYTPQSADSKTGFKPKNVWKADLSSGYKSELPLKVLIHGYSSKSFMYNILQAYMNVSKSNVVVVDWEKLANKPCYLTASINTIQVGKCTGIAIGAYLKPKNSIHIIGFSLGAHIAGYTSSFMLQHYGRKINRITGLDPALPLYTTPIDFFKLDPSDANFVDVIHTSIGFGNPEPLGHQDFYVNDVYMQPGCATSSNSMLCSHSRSTKLFAESIYSLKFLATPCPSIWSLFAGYCSFSESKQKTIMGEHANKTARGMFVIKTNQVPPYAMG